jgi:nucleoside-diphosphate-sugar epimerase
MERRDPIIVVTGATGFLGSHYVSWARGQGYQVRGTGRNAEEGKKLVALGAEFFPMDLAVASESDLDALVRGADAVIHCAALSSVWGRYEDFYLANVTGTEKIAKASQRASVRRFVHISSPSIYIAPMDRLAIRESEALPDKKINFYAETKALAEKCVDDQVKVGLSSITLRPQGIFGIGDRAILPRIIRVARRGFFPIIRSRDVTIDLTAVENVVHAIECARQASDAFTGKKYNITNGEPIQNSEAVSIVLKGIGISYREKFIGFRRAWTVATVLEFVHRRLLGNSEPLLTRYSVCALGFTRTLDISAAERDLGYHPVIRLRPALERTISWLKASGF